MIVSESRNPFEWSTPSEIRTQFVYQCSVPYCGNRLIREYLGLTPDIPKYPGPGWRMVGDVWVCPNHAVSITIDGKEPEYK